VKNRFNCIFKKGKEDLLAERNKTAQTKMEDALKKIEGSTGEGGEIDEDYLLNILIDQKKASIA